MAQDLNKPLKRASDKDLRQKIRDVLDDHNSWIESCGTAEDTEEQLIHSEDTLIDIEQLIGLPRKAE